MHTLLILIAICAMTFTAVALILDLRTRRLPNWLTVSAFVAGVLFHTVTGGLAGLGISLTGFAVGFGALFVLWCIGGGGGGDVKMMGALGAWLGAPLTVIVFLVSALIAASLLVVIFTWRFATGAKSLPAAERSGTAAKDKLEETRRTMPYAVPVAMATWSVMIVKLISASQ
ncbi:A24 family peptidase [Lignipirellula cremea]|uniref:Type IV leader peptidase family protein n=1 Tax=Lignipirellula cremea TaxID=2528010 RepID=A0A518E563_9BACT|nr:A24 family peptidase [Lignipirellula cremea]QDU99208.1 Type IV leader peptidase family protein [Lignipirellula cremea]